MKPFNQFINGVKYGISYFTIVPIKKSPILQESIFYKGVLLSLPLIGLFLSALTIVCFMFLPFPPLYKAIFISILYLFSYGFVHIHGLSNTLDGFFISSNEQKTDIYDLIENYQIGAIGAIGSFCFILLKILSLSFLLYYECYLMIIIALILSRSSIFFALDLEYHKKSYFIKNIQKSFKTSIFIKLLFLPFTIFTKFILHLVKKKLGFLHDDTLGFTIELQEIIYLNIGILYFIL